MTDELPIFPLPDIALFPYALLPLHIFEPRYRAMIADVLRGSQHLAIARLRPGFETDYEGRPPIYDVAGAGVCLSADRLPDGRYNVMLRGVARVYLEEELPPDKPYRVCRCRVLPDGVPARDTAMLQRELIAVCDRLADVVPDGDSLKQLARAVPAPGGCADVVASALLRDPDARQTLLELLDPADRLDKMIEHVSMLVARMRGGTGALN